MVEQLNQSNPIYLEQFEKGDAVKAQFLAAMQTYPVVISSLLDLH